MIEIRCLNPAQLEAFVNDRDFDKQPHLPISVHRGHSHVHNPRALATDTLLLLACEGDGSGDLLGYLGVLPDQIQFPGEDPLRVGWLSCMWVDPQKRGMGISKKLVGKALELYHGRILVTEFTVPAGNLYDRLGAFVSLHQSHGLRLYQRLDLHGILQKKGGKWLKIKGLLAVVDAIGNAVADLRFVGASGPARWTFEQVDRVDEEAMAFIEAHRGQELFRRGAAELNWMLEWPWMLGGRAYDEMSRKYEFSSVARFFQNDVFKVRDEAGQMQMFLFFARRDRNLKLNYLYFAPGLESEVAAILKYFMRKWRINTALIYHPALVAVLNHQKMGLLYRKAALRQYIIGKEFAEQAAAGGFLIQDGDADCGFT